MNATCLVLDSGCCDPALNMALDEALLRSAPRISQPVLRFYGWNVPAATFGYFQKYTTVQKATQLRPLIRRPTGGGVVPHDADWTYSVTIPAGGKWYEQPAASSYRRMHEWVQTAFKNIGVDTELAADSHKPRPGECFEGYEVSDVLWHGRKVAGAAQRRTRTGLLIQGSVQPPPVPVRRGDWQRAMAQCLDAPALDWKPEPWLDQQACVLAREKYSCEAYNQRR